MNSFDNSWRLIVAAIVSFVLVAVIVFILLDRFSLDESFFWLTVFSIMFISTAAIVSIAVYTLHSYVRPLRRIAEETNLITAINASHRIKIQGAREVRQLAQLINEKAKSFEELQKNIRQKIEDAKATAEHERNILAAIVSEMPDGILICNAEGQILLYNKQARRYLDAGACGLEAGKDVKTPAADTPNPYIGLGRSVFRVIDKNLIVNALDEIAVKLHDNDATTSSHFIVRNIADMLIYAEMVPILNSHRHITGFVLILQDNIKDTAADSRTSFLIRSLTLDVRAALQNIEASIEAIIEDPEMDHTQKEQFKKRIHREAIKSCSAIDKCALDCCACTMEKRPLIRLLGNDLLETLKKQAADNIGIFVKVVSANDQTWIKAEVYSLVLAMLFILTRLHRETRVDKFTCKLEREGKFAVLDLCWQGKPIKIQTLRDWETEIVAAGGSGIPSTLKEVLDHHGTKMWPATMKLAPKDNRPETKPYVHDELRSKSGLRLFFPDVETAAPDTLRTMMVLPGSRPEFYDFDLFNCDDQPHDSDNILLSELTYTAFDTETTGLYPLAGDEIISIGAVRIVNGRLLHDEFFDQLVDPQRDHWDHSIDIHNIHPEMLIGQPSIDKVLPVFKQFVEDSVLVAHNAAFDMCMLQMKENFSGVKFTNPVLDTLLLSAVVHPSQDRHTLEAVAERLGVSVVGRHTALGDALVTGEILLKLIPLLAQMGIHSLGEARLASQKTYFARFKY